MHDEPTRRRGLSRGASDRPHQQEPPVEPHPVRRRPLHSTKLTHQYVRHAHGGATRMGSYELALSAALVGLGVAYVMMA